MLDALVLNPKTSFWTKLNFGQGGNVFTPRLSVCVFVGRITQKVQKRWGCFRTVVLPVVDPKLGFENQTLQRWTQDLFGRDSRRVRFPLKCVRYIKPAHEFQFHVSPRLAVRHTKASHPFLLFHVIRLLASAFPIFWQRHLCVNPQPRTMIISPQMCMGGAHTN